VVVLGVDPGLVVAGFGVVSCQGGRIMLLDCGIVKLSSSQPIPERLSYLREFFNSKIDAWGVTDLVLETPFMGKNAQNFLKLGYVRGVLYLAVHEKGLRVREFAPCEVKRAVTGFGAAEKEQVARVIMRLFPGVVPEQFDMTDAIALALCGIWRAGS
jgi:crossover junction endodeoxyribonuclease RuvC